MRTILLIMIGLSAFLSADFTKIGDVVTDSRTGLEWQDNNNSNGTQRIWKEAINYCKDLSLNGEDDWRLPNVNEFKSILDRSTRVPAIVNVFEYVSSDYYWSSTSILGAEYNAWFISFGDGSVDEYMKDANGYVRCVRDGQ